MKYRNIGWDWNGTLLDDVEVGVNTLNDMLTKRGLKTLSQEEYKDKFGFPVVDFYHAIGFDMEKESLHEISVDFVETYDLYGREVKLHTAVSKVLAEIQRRGYRQYILSALREDLLQDMLTVFSIGERFEKACGSDNIYAAGKIDRGLRMLKDCTINPAETLMVGDTLHDAEVAAALGFDCVLYSGGHNSEWRLRQKGPVISRLEQLIEEKLS